jgi:hypothetical protein
LSLPRSGQALLVFAIMVFLLLLLGLACLRTYPDNRDLLDVFFSLLLGLVSYCQRGPNYEVANKLGFTNQRPEDRFYVYLPDQTLDT